MKIAHLISLTDRLARDLEPCIEAARSGAPPAAVAAGFAAAIVTAMTALGIHLEDEARTAASQEHQPSPSVKM